MSTVGRRFFRLTPPCSAWPALFSSVARLFTPIAAAPSTAAPAAAGAASATSGKKRPRSPATTKRWTAQEKLLFAELREQHNGQWKAFEDAWRSRHAQMKLPDSELRLFNSTQLKTHNQSVANAAAKKAGGVSAKAGSGKQPARKKRKVATRMP
jgi:hypothetical protein